MIQSPKIVKPIDLLKARNKRKCNGLSPIRKRPIISPLRTLDPNIQVKCVTSSTATQENVSPKNKRKKVVAKRHLKFSPAKSSKECLSVIDESANLEAPASVKSDPNSLTFVPIDWSIKTKIRFTTKKPIPYKGYFSLNEKANGFCSFIRGQDTAKLDFATELNKNCYTCQNPHIVGFDLFPRINNRCKRSPISKPDGELLFNDYWVSLEHLFSLLTSRLCAYFYVCTDSFTVLFRAAGVGGIDEIHAVINPTNESFRKMLKEEKITYSMPIFDQEKESQEKLGPKKASEDEINCVSYLDVDEEASMFLESVGLDPDKIITKKSACKVNRHSTGLTCVLVKGSDVNHLIPILSRKTVVSAKFGPLANIPPTLLAPVNFQRCYVEDLKLKQSKYIEKDCTIYNLEISGPILPQVVHNLCKLFEKELGEFKVETFNYESSPALTAFHSALKPDVEKTKLVFAYENLKDCGLSRDFTHKLVSFNHQSTKSYTRFSFENGKYAIL